MELLFGAVLIVTLVAILVVPNVLEALRVEQRRRLIERERVLADIRLRQIAQAGFLSMVSEARRTRDGRESG